MHIYIHTYIVAQVGRGLGGRGWRRGGKISGQIERLPLLTYIPMIAIFSM